MNNAVAGILKFFNEIFAFLIEFVIFFTFLFFHEIFPILHQKVFGFFCFARFFLSLFSLYRHK